MAYDITKFTVGSLHKNGEATFKVVANFQEGAKIYVEFEKHEIEVEEPLAD